MVFFAFHHYLAANFHLNIFFVGNYISVLFAAWNDVSIYFVSNISWVILIFIFCECLCYLRKKPQYFTCDFLEKFVLSFFFEQDLCFDKICFCSASLGITNVLVFEIAR